MLLDAAIPSTCSPFPQLAGSEQPLCCLVRQSLCVILCQGRVLHFQSLEKCFAFQGLPYIISDISIQVSASYSFSIRALALLQETSYAWEFNLLWSSVTFLSKSLFTYSSSALCLLEMSLYIFRQRNHITFTFYLKFLYFIYQSTHESLSACFYPTHQYQK